SGGLGVDDQLELRRLYNRQLHWLRALEDAAGIDAYWTKRIRKVTSVAHQPAGFAKSRPGYTAGIAWRDARLASCTRRLLKKASPPTKRASGRSRTNVAKAALISPLVPALSTWICSPMARAATFMSRNALSEFVASAGLTSTATRMAAGTSSRRS